MTTLRQQNKLLWIAFITLTVVIFLSIGGLFIYMSSQKPHTDKVCITTKEFKSLHSNKPSQLRTQEAVIDDSRDRRVLNDPLYPALNRSEFDTHQGIAEKVKSKVLYNTTQDFTDRYRLVAYVTNQDQNKDSGGNTWKLMARQKDRNQAEFFMIPANNNYDMKVMLNNEMIVGNEKLRDTYTIPKQLTFKSPLLNETPYEVTELPMNDFTNAYN